ncbi:MAG TPA: ATP-binding protein [Acidimicrobiales bacterium]|nr:ATP-binding protein [Acidimicrobiales bacterium]
MRSSRLKSQLDEMRRDYFTLEAELEAADSSSHRLSEVIGILPIGVLVVRDDGSTAAENARLVSPTADPGINLLVQEAALEAAKECIRLNEPVSREVDVHGPPAHLFEITARRLTNGEVACLVEDVSERRRLADIRRDFIVNASHELRTPIGAIALLAETLEHEDDQGTLRRLAAHITREAERARSLLEDVLGLARLEGGDAGDRGPVDLAWVAKEAAGRLAALAQQCGVTVEVDLQEPVSITGSADQLVSALSNLVDNAVKYSSPGGHVRVTIGREGGWAKAEVTDDGRGIPSRDLDRIFERFYRADRGRDRRTGGTGLGLAIVRHVVENHGGEVRVESQEGRGSRFCLLFPDPL